MSPAMIAVAILHGTLVVLGGIVLIAVYFAMDPWKGDRE